MKDNQLNVETVELNKRFSNFEEYMKMTHGGARVISSRELTSDCVYISTLDDGPHLRHVFLANYCGQVQCVEFWESKPDAAWPE